MANTFESLTKDMSKGAQRIVKNQAILDELTPQELSDLQEKLNNYYPKAEAGQVTKTSALGYVSNSLEVNRLNAAENVPVEESETAQEALESIPATVKTEIEVAEFDAEQAGQKMRTATCVLELHIRQPSFIKKISAAQLMEGGKHDGKADTDMLHVAQDLIDRAELKDLQSHRGAMVKYIKSIGVPCSMLAPGLYLMPLSRVDEIDEKISEFTEGRKTLLNEFEAKYEAIKITAKEKRGDFYNEDEYPAFDKIRETYKVDYRYLSLNVPAAMESMNNEIFRREEQKARAEWADATLEVRSALRAGFTDLVKHFEERLGVDEETGKMKVFHGTRVENLKAFIEVFNDRNLTNDSELETLVSQAKKLIDGINDVGDLRKDKDARLELEKAFAGISAASEQLIATTAGRQFDFDDED